MLLRPDLSECSSFYLYTQAQTLLSVPDSIGRVLIYPPMPCTLFGRTADAPRQMVVDETRGLQKGVADGGAEEFEAAAAQVAAEGIALGRGDGYFGQCAEMVPYGFAVRKKGKHVIVKVAVFLLHFDEKARIGDGRFYFQPVADNAVALRKALHIGVGHGGHSLDVEIAERAAVTLALFQNGEPAEAGLRTLQDEELKECAVVGNRPPPLRVVVTHIGFVGAAPTAPPVD